MADAYGDAAKALVAVITALNAQIDQLEAALAERLEQDPDAVTYRSLPGLVTRSAPGCSAGSMRSSFLGNPA